MHETESPAPVPRDVTERRVRAWRSLDEAMADPLFQQCRGIMGTASYGQDDALFRAIRHFAASGVGVDAKPIDTRQLKQTLEAATRCLQRNDWGTAFDRVQDALALLPDGVTPSDGGQR